MRLKSLRYLIIVSLSALPIASFSASNDYDGKWKVVMECGQTLQATRAGGNVKGFVEIYNWDIQNSEGNYNNRRGSREMEWKLQIKDKKISVNSFGISDIRSQHIAFKGELITESRFELKGELFNKGSKLRDCKMTGEMIEPASGSLAAKKSR